MRVRTSLAAAIIMVLIMTLSALAADGAAHAQGRELVSDELPTNQIMIQFNSSITGADLQSGGGDVVLAELSQAAGMELTYVRPMSGGGHVLALPVKHPPVEVAAISARLRRLPSVANAEPDLIKQVYQPESLPQHIANVTPDDLLYGEQWHYRYVPGEDEGLNLPAAWTISTGSADTVVAVVDTGIVDHPDLAGRTAPGYDFVSDLYMANDGDGRDNDPSDPGDWVEFGDCGLALEYDSTWHGTHVAGTIGAASNNGQGVAGVNWQAKILPVRALGKCGGMTSDIVDAVRWSAGLPVTGAPANPNPADVINLSLGGSGDCSAFEQAALDEVLAVGSTVVIAAGNNTANAANYSPGNCDDIITVGATDRGGNRASYSNYGSVVELSAPGGETSPTTTNGVLSTLNDGEKSPASPSYAYYQGTSMATPHVAGLASLVLAMDPTLTPAQVLTLLQQNARPFPTGSSCTTSLCGIGIVDAYATLQDLQLSDLDPYLFLPFLSRPAPLPQARFASAAYSVGESGGNMQLTVKLDMAASGEVSVGYQTFNGSATADHDYAGKSGLLTFSPGQTDKSLSISIINDGDQEPPETFEVALHSPQGLALGSPSKTTVTIWDDDGSNAEIGNGDFEAGRMIWTEYSSNDYIVILNEADLPVSAHGGRWAAWLGQFVDDISYIEQRVRIPAAEPYLTFWRWIDSEDFACGWDYALVVVDGGTIADIEDLCTIQNTDGWQAYSVDLSDWAEQTVDIQIRVVNDGYLESNFYVDDVAFSPIPSSASDTLFEGASLTVPGFRR